MFDLKTKYDESDNLAVRMTRSITDKVGQLFGEYIIKTCFCLGRFSGHNMYRQCLNMIDFGPSSYQVQFLDVNFLIGTLCRHVQSPVLVTGAHFLLLCTVLSEGILSMCYWFTGSMSKTELSVVLTEICKIDPTFDKEEFLKFCKKDVIPNVLEVSEQLSNL